MERGSSRLAIRTFADHPSHEISKMSTLTMPSPHHHHLGFHREFAGLGARPEPSYRPYNDPERIALPSIRQAFPEFQLHAQQDGIARTPPATSPTSGPFPGTITPPEYVHSPSHSKRRRLSFEHEREPERASQVPRLYNSPSRVAHRQQSPPSGPRPSQDLWANANRTSPYVGNGVLPSVRSPARVESHERVEVRPTLPSLPLLNFERGAGEMYGIRGRSGEDFTPEPTRRPSLACPSSAGYGMEPVTPPAYRQANFSYGYHHPSRAQSLSVGSAHPFDRTPFSSGYGHGHGHGHPYHPEQMMRMGSDFGMGVNVDSKQRKRRGNLPKETTDKLRAWFMTHLEHPYPTEDEKQEFMRQTGLQMNQISNWFINARRRQLPTINKNARVESDATTAGRGCDGRVILSAEREYDSSEGKPLSDGEGSSYDDSGLEALSRRSRALNMKRDSI
ncbi:hypothetical protein F4780DRAFT_479367 [Xylariomycetidae sp. FL0641]|nr:hypothetical protein F4780DRAFT_479367 [Xylariomycetidae sp. FL0641]